jgi:hypothetical protein
MSPKIAVIAAARVLEARARTSPRLIRAARRAVAALCRISPEARALVRLRLMRLV